MIYTRSGTAHAFESGRPFPDDALWVDMLHPAPEEMAWLQKQVSIALPSPDEMTEIQVSSQTYADEHGMVITTPVIAGTDSKDYQIGAVSFILTPSLFISIRQVDPSAIRHFGEKFQSKVSDFLSPGKIFLGLMDMLTDRSVDVLEKIGDRADLLSAQIFKDQTAHQTTLQQTLRQIGQTGELLGQLRNAMAGTERGMMFLIGHSETILDKAGIAQARTVQRDIHSLGLHADALQQRIVFLLDAILGVINIEQNNVVRVFTVASTAFMPPMLIASLYGMNFQFMPELSWHVGYPLAVVAMLASALLPLAFFRRKGWI